MKTNKRRIVLFLAVGAFNTGLDTGIYLLLIHAGLDILKANTISTAIALIVSYNLNKRLTFNDRFADRKTFWKFLGVTMVGLWVLQPLVIFGALGLLSFGWFSTFMPMLQPYSNLIAKLVATSASVVWNYFLYNLFVFKDHRAQSQAK